MQLSIAQQFMWLVPIVAWSHRMVHVQCRRSKRTTQLGSSRQILQVCISEAELVILAVRCTFLNCLSLNKHAEHARPVANKLCLQGYMILAAPPG